MWEEAEIPRENPRVQADKTLHGNNCTVYFFALFQIIITKELNALKL